jgi:hypothetical protein
MQLQRALSVRDADQCLAPVTHVPDISGQEIVIVGSGATRKSKRNRDREICSEKLNLFLRGELMYLASCLNLPAEKPRDRTSATFSVMMERMF